MRTEAVPAPAVPESGQVTVVCEGLVRVYRSGTGEAHALRGVDVTFRAGAVTAIAGPSGSGKSSLLRMLALQDLPSAGRLVLLGNDVGSLRRRGVRRLRRRHVSFVEQRSSRGLFPHLTAAEHVHQVAVLRADDGAAAPGRRSSGRALDAMAVLRTVGLEHRAGSRPATLSGGEQQRLAVALALLGTPDVVVADEPTAELDHDNTDAVLAALAGAADRGSTVVLSTHDERALRVADRVLRLRHGVLSSEQVLRGHHLATIDSTGRVQLPPDALLHFPDGRALLDVTEDGVVLRRPDGTP
ncbi:ABC transporter ATP-binding protein [Actinotalea sp. Marseille-Q4924]|uniref:ABC transporter ATP-binding protein n=1 Tax=Actinotalea sp. Marseille-Q4924 TaxID=2866571 RepID=UPI001CE3CBBA|nr:ATP-binding cassette domain-containing protein [Actinotalea sp. Marseille-Q4924]